MAMAARAGLVDESVAKYAVDQMIAQMYPQFAEQQQAEMQPQEQQQLSPEEFDKMVALSQMFNKPQTQNTAPPMTQAAVESVMRGITPAM